MMAKITNFKNYISCHFLFYFLAISVIARLLLYDAKEFHEWKKLNQIHWKIKTI